MASPINDPGALTARLALERPVLIPDGQGGSVTAFEVIARLWARIEPVTAQTEERAGAEVFTVSHRIWLRRREGLAAGMRFTRGTAGADRHFEIRTIRDPDESGRFLVCDCTEEGA